MGAIKQETLFPLEFFISETPKSQQASPAAKERWKMTLRDAAKKRARETDEIGLLDERCLAVTIFYFAPDIMPGDIDNIIKPILDGMKTVAYIDDKTIERVLAQKFEPGNERGFGEVSETLAKALDADPPVVYVRVDDDLSWRFM